MVRNVPRIILLTLTGAVPGIVSAQAVNSVTQSTAAADDSAAIGEVVVTARRRAESVLSIPVAVQAISAQDLANSGTFDFQELARSAPGFDFKDQGSGEGGRYLSEIRFRGLGTNESSANATTSNQVGSLFVDGIYAEGVAQSIGFEDVERVEVIKGPQSAYFGRSTFAGAVNYITKDPGKTPGAEVNLDYSPTFGSYAMSGSVDGSLIDGVLAARITASSREKGAQYTANDGGSLGQERTNAIATTILFTPTDATRIKARVSFSEDRDGSPAFAYVGYNESGNCAAGTPVTFRNTAGQTVHSNLAINWQCGALPYGQQISMITHLSTYPAGPAPGQVELNLPAVFLGNSLNNPLLGGAPKLDNFGLARDLLRFTLLGDQKLTDRLTLSGSLGYNRQDLNQIRDFNAGDQPVAFQEAPAFFRDFSAETRLNYNGGPLRLVAGANYYHQTIDGGFLNGIEIIGDVRYCATCDTTRIVHNGTTNNSNAINTTGFFGSIDYDILDNVTATFEGRYQIDRVTTYAGLPGDNGPGSTLESKRFLPRAILSWHPSELSTLYGSYSVGTLPGQFNAQYLTLTPAQKVEVQNLLPGTLSSIGPETLESYEIGFKQRLRDPAISYALTLYNMLWKNMPSTQSVFVADLANNIFSAAVPGKSRIKGIEFEGDWDLFSHLRLNGTTAYTNARYVDYATSTFSTFFGQPASAGYRADGNTLPQYPAIKASLGATYDGTVNDRFGWYVRGDAFYNGKQFVDESNLSYVSAYTTANLRFGVTAADGRQRVELYVTNLFDKKGWSTASREIDLSQLNTNLSNLGQGAFVTPIDLREVGIRVSSKF